MSSAAHGISSCHPWCLHLPTNIICLRSESLLETHDLQFPLKTPTLNQDNTTTHDLRVLLLSPSITQPDLLPTTLARITRLAHKYPSHNNAIIFLLASPLPESSTASALGTRATSISSSSPTTALATLQAATIASSELAAIPILPLSCLASLPALLQHYVAGLAQPPPAPSRIDMLDLLAGCTVGPGGLDRQTACVVADCVPSLRALARLGAAGEGEWEGGREEGEIVKEQMEGLRGLVGEEEMRGMMEFWRKEWEVG